jgi:hypothetical protein
LPKLVSMAHLGFSQCQLTSFHKIDFLLSRAEMETLARVRNDQRRLLKYSYLCIDGKIGIPALRRDDLAYAILASLV